MKQANKQYTKSIIHIHTHMHTYIQTHKHVEALRLMYQPIPEFENNMNNFLFLENKCLQSINKQE